jgi:hypothetical protein
MNCYSNFPVAICDFPGNSHASLGNPGVSNVAKLGRPWEVTNMSQTCRKAATGKWFWDVPGKFPVSTVYIILYMYIYIYTYIYIFPVSTAYYIGGITGDW